MLLLTKYWPLGSSKINISQKSYLNSPFSPTFWSYQLNPIKSILRIYQCRSRTSGTIPVASKFQSVSPSGVFPTTSSAISTSQHQYPKQHQLNTFLFLFSYAHIVVVYRIPTQYLKKNHQSLSFPHATNFLDDKPWLYWNSLVIL